MWKINFYTEKDKNMDSYLPFQDKPISFRNNINENIQGSNFSSSVNLVPVSEIPVKYQPIFDSFPYFNIVQSTVFEDAFYTDKHLVVSAPTGSGKTVVFELCIVRLLVLISELNQNPSVFKIVYMAPVKSLCNERFEDWKAKFESLGILCIQLTGDSENEDYFELQKYSLIITTPEKWDSVTRLWQNNRSLVQLVKLLLIDEIHLLNEEERGATLEATLSRMKTIQLVLSCKTNKKLSKHPDFRFVAVSATFPNIEDAANWLSSPKTKGVFYKLNENLRPVCLKKVVIGYPSSDKISEFKFDLMLSYKLNHVIQTYSEKKPALVFCSTRKSVIQTAITLYKHAKFVINASHKLQLTDAANSIHDSALRECVLNGVGFHHGGLDVSDRRLLENLFLNSHLLVLVSTSTLAMGVNLPAHLVVIKSTSVYAAGCYKEYSDSQILQMIGRAGRPQFDRNATAVIMTKLSLQAKYESLVDGTQLIESNLHKHMVEHLNAEIVLGAITDMSIAMEWLKATFLYQRIFKNPEYYGMSSDLPREKIERKLQDICVRELNGLRKYGFILMDDDSFYLKPTKSGHLMAKYYIAYETMKQFTSLTGNENLAELIMLISSCKEFDDIHLRVNEKKCLNGLNKSKITAIRFPLPGKIKTRQMKINCLIQATFGCLTISEPSLNQDVARIFRNASRVSKCLVEYISVVGKGFTALLNAVILSKCFKARLWENSKYVARQLEKIGVTLSNILVNSGITTFDDILKTNPRELELILNRNPPFGTLLVESAKKIPRYSLHVEQNLDISGNVASICIVVTLENLNEVQDAKNSSQHGCYILIGNADNSTILYQKILNNVFLQNQYWTKKINIARSQKGDEVNICVISDTFVGLDSRQSYSIIYSNFNIAKDRKNEPENSSKMHSTGNINPKYGQSTRDCNHKCLNKVICSHSCCKTGIIISTPRKSQMANFMEQIQNKMNCLSSKKVKMDIGTFSKNINMFNENESNSTSLNFDLALPENWQDNESVVQNGINDIPDVDTCNRVTSQQIWKNEDQMNKDNDNIMISSEEPELQHLYFDLNFKDCLSQERNLDAPKMNSQEYYKIEESFCRKETKFEKIFDQLKQVHKIEEWDDPLAAEETFNTCLNFLSSNY